MKYRLVATVLLLVVLSMVVLLDSDPSSTSGGTPLQATTQSAPDTAGFSSIK